jgi:hypothetical protein
LKTICTICLGIVVSSILSPAGAQTHVIKSDLVRPIRGLFSIAYERKLNDLLSVQLCVDGGRYQEGSIFFDKDYQLRGFSFIPEVRMYPFQGSRKAPLGVFIGGAFRYAFMKEEMYDPFASVSRTNSGHIYNYGLELGYKYQIQKLVLEVLGGFGSGRIRNFQPLPYQLWVYQEVRNEEIEFYRLELSFGFIF